MDKLEKHRAVFELGLRAIDYYIDTGFCVFCDADDVKKVPHEEHCNVGVLSEVTLNQERIDKKEEQRLAAYMAILRKLQSR